MDLGTSTRPPIGRRMKSRAPPPPPAPQPAPRRIFRNAIPDGGGSPGCDTKENILRTAVDLHITLPVGYQTTVTVDGRKALMDLLVDLCSQYHLNPAYHTLELLSPEALPVAFKPNALLGTLDVSCALIKERVTEERVIRKPPPKVPEKTVRLVVNYHHGQKAVVRVNPMVPLQSLVPVICQKCEFDPAHVLLLQDSISNHELDLRKSLSELDIRELYVLDQTLVLQPKMASAPVLNYSAEYLRSNSQSASGVEKKGFLGLFKLNRRKSKGLSVVGGPCVEVRPNTLGQSQSAMNLSRLSPKTEPKKRRAPAPPPPPTAIHTTAMISQTKQDSPRADSQLKKRKAPAPPPTPAPSTPEPVLTVPVAVVHVPARTQCRTAIPVPVLSSTLLAGDSLSDLSHSVEDSEPAGSVCSGSSSDDAAESATSSLAEEPMMEPTNERPVILIAEPQPEPNPESNPQPTPRNAVKQEPDRSPTPEETESALELKMDEMENNRHSAIAWLHKTEQEIETVSMCSSESLADQGYAASEGMADDSGLLSSPSDLTHPASPEDTISLNHNPSPIHIQPKDCSSDSDEGCATWGSRHSADVHQSDKRQDCYEDANITAQIQLTLADLDADLAEVNHSDEASACVDDEIPVSDVDMDIPVTTIDEVTDDDQSSLNVHESFCQPQSMNKQDITSGLNTPSVDVQNKNNNACVSDKRSASQTQVDQIQYREKVVTCPEMKVQLDLEKANILNGNVPQRSQSPVVFPVVQSAQNAQESRLRPPPLVRSYSLENPEMQRELSIKPPTAAQIKITPSPVSRFGLKTFTVIPPKPAVSQNHTPARSLGTGAIKIDELGNMVKQIEARPASAQDRYGSLDEPTNDVDSPLLGKAKAFWSSAEKQDPAPAAYKGASVKTKEAEVPKAVPVTVIFNPQEKPSVEEVNGSINHSASGGINKLPVSDPSENTSVSEQRKNLLFLKPSRRTSSQYVASAIAKYTGNPSAKVNGMQELPESSGGQRQLANQGFIPDIRSHHKDASTKPVPYSAGYKSSQSYASRIAEKQTSTEEPPFNTANNKSLNSSPVNTKPQQEAQASACSPSTLHSTQSSTSIKSSPEISPPTQTQKVTTRPPVPKKPDIYSAGVMPEPNQVTVFGPVKKFKPVMLKSVEKETSLHSSLMEAIQTGEGIQRLRKVSGSSLTSSRKNPSFVETENERSALLSAIRAQSNSTRLKKTRSEAAEELDEFRKAEEDRATQRDTPSPTPPDPPAFIPPPPPVFAPPPPPPPSGPPKPALVLPAGRNPELAREEMLEAIRSGAAAERLRKVPAAVKTRKVNSRLGIIQASTSVSQEH